MAPLAFDRMDSQDAHAQEDSGRGQLADLRECLRGYISPMMSETVLKAGLHRMGKTEESLAGDELEHYVSQVMLALRIFVAQERLPELMVDLALLLERHQVNRTSEA